ncbi:host-nuclease inhibitor Gam family protein [Tepidanaerobacter syntrophicus]|uniref:host-nuclease inhibitor Gam family protein n=1 Tax=Tepidanaerobacter syntrophicus TaxID=224999 RepID=UPI001BD3FB7F|nr:host-nuclease inhibitor Gam family protein [Tepidanaerobacter syntrophicus]
MIEEYEIINDIADDMVSIKDGWQITDDNKADWALEKIAAIDADLARKEMAAQNKIAQIQEWLAKEKAQADQQRSFFEVKLREYFEILPAKVIKETKTQKSYKLPSGTLKIKYRGPKIIRDDAKLLAWVNQNKPRFVKIKQSVDWSGLKELTKIDGDKVIDIQTGEIIDGIIVEQIGSEFIVEV